MLSLERKYLWNNCLRYLLKHFYLFPITRGIFGYISWKEKCTCPNIIGGCSVTICKQKTETENCMCNFEITDKKCIVVHFESKSEIDFWAAVKRNSHRIELGKKLWKKNETIGWIKSGCWRALSANNANETIGFREVPAAQLSKRNLQQIDLKWRKVFANAAEPRYKIGAVDKVRSKIYYCELRESRVEKDMSSRARLAAFTDWNHSKCLGLVNYRWNTHDI